MIELVEANWPYFLIALLIGIAVAWFIFVANRKTTITRDDTDDNAAGTATRNQALIDAEPVALKDQPVPAPMAASVGMAGAGPAVAAAVQDAAAKAGTSDDLTRIKGVGPKLVAILHANEVTTFSQIAGWNDADIDRIDSKLGRFEGRIRRDDWVKQAKMLAEGDTQAYESQFGKL
ncbi:hypothetical protein OAS19_03145 [Altererythrobacter sp.]|nr:hypothetical protein [Altererythrobacter sp.]